ncbi:MAG TPA: hypothetical protein VFG72_16515 [Marmoricola sp.]|nr:hypothetical protein [Marmoricola sp.]
MVTTRRGNVTRWATAVFSAMALAAGLTVASAGAAHAVGWDDDPNASNPLSSKITGPMTGQVGNCSVVSSPAFLGLSCGSATGAVVTAEEILDGDPVPECWHEPLTEAELAAVGYEDTPGPEGSRWFWERCMKGIDPETFEIRPGGITFTIGLVNISNGDPTKSLTRNQQELVRFHNDDRQIPAPVAISSPSALPRVGSWVSFFNGTEDEVTASAGAVALRGRITGIEVEPLGATKSDSVACAGTGIRAEADDTPATLPSACWYRYAKSSSGQPLVSDQGLPSYPVVITATWSVDTVIDGVATPFNTFTKSQVTSLPVTEIQAIVVN